MSNWACAELPSLVIIESETSNANLDWFLGVLCEAGLLEKSLLAAQSETEQSEPGVRSL